MFHTTSLYEHGDLTVSAALLWLLDEFNVCIISPRNHQAIRFPRDRCRKLVSIGKSVFRIPSQRNVSGEPAPNTDAMSLLYRLDVLAKIADGMEQRLDVTSIASMALRHRKRGPLIKQV